MFGVILTGHGGPERLVWRDDLPDPEPGPGEVRIAVAASAVNNTDINTRVGWYSAGGAGAADDASWTGEPVRFPLIQGIDACGRIESVGEGVDPALTGRRVLVEPCLREPGARSRARFLGSDCDGAFAQFCVVPARHAVPVDSPLGDEELASFPCSWSTAENMIVRAGAKGGERALVTGASGGVGSAAVCLLRARGVEVVAVTGPDKAPAVMALGAAATLGRDDDPVARFGPHAFDLVIDLAGGPAMPRLLDALRPGGRYAVAGAVAGPRAELDLRTLYLKDLTLYGCTVLGEGVFAGLVARIESGAVAPLLAQVFPLRRIHEAQAAFLRRDHIGKIGLRIA